MTPDERNHAMDYLERFDEHIDQVEDEIWFLAAHGEEDEYLESLLWRLKSDRKKLLERFPECRNLNTKGGGDE